MQKWAKQKGFTIVELLIVIVVIGILAVITITAYNGFQQRATNEKTTQAFAAWIKSMKLYKADKGQWPPFASCLGTGYLYGVSGTDTSGIAQCRQNDAGSNFTENAAFKTAMIPYIGTNLPTPAFVTARATDTNWRRGLSYLYGGGTGGTQVYIEVAYVGVLTSCPKFFFF
jgi:prepilin-type N-terminal cleavage/methylation domain-containing protein